MGAGAALVAGSREEFPVYWFYALFLLFFIVRFDSLVVYIYCK